MAFAPILISRLRDLIHDQRLERILSKAEQGQNIDRNWKVWKEKIEYDKAKDASHVTEIGLLRLLHALGGRYDPDGYLVHASQLIQQARKHFPVSRHQTNCGSSNTQHCRTRGPTNKKRRGQW